jgi:hypothetical protein
MFHAVPAPPSCRRHLNYRQSLNQAPKSLGIRLEKFGYPSQRSSLGVAYQADDEPSLAISPLSSGRVALPDLRLGGLLRRLPQPARRSMTLIGAGVLSGSAPPKLPAACNRSQRQSPIRAPPPPLAAPHRRLAVTDEGSPHALRSTRNRPRTALHLRCQLVMNTARDDRVVVHAMDDRAGPCQRFARNCATRTLALPHLPILHSAFHLRDCVS